MISVPDFTIENFLSGASKQERILRFGVNGGLAWSFDLIKPEFWLPGWQAESALQGSYGVMLLREGPHQAFGHAVILRPLGDLVDVPESQGDRWVSVRRVEPDVVIGSGEVDGRLWIDVVRSPVDSR